MTGWRLGYGVMPEWLVEGVNKLMVNSNSCTAKVSRSAPESQPLRVLRTRCARWSPNSAAARRVRGGAE